MEVYRISKCRYINDLSGFGAANFPGRWNSKGTHVLYTAATASLALLENVVHIPAIPAENYCIATFNIPDGSFFEYDIKALPSNWNIYPAAEALKEIGDAFIAAGEWLALKLPSAIMPEDSIYLLNPQHPEFSKVKIVSVREITVDKRLLK